ncbi:MAG: hypothetical protein A2Y62_07745 [Candidatus Fischerbacteria bacterium RBG_13_37_8]|uniref:Exonuclease domain-containing protein n=1 Tax=Candidatus Fischerbacteria bacterium RBG_13_37_8 TaxID=1817863 RepID=A0A1F5V9G1_9BACT|nr:MAG: hypothetical protein A2Y62_07745 [Candidatus Fischerbacteria bacterium RBG_13_37_8]
MELFHSRQSYLYTPLEELSFISIDTETTGLYPDKGDKICEIAAVLFHQKRKHFEPLGFFWYLINPLRSIPEETSQIHGITDEIIKYSPSFTDIIPSFLEFINNSILAAYNSDFDMYFINKELQNNGSEALSNPTIDVLKLARGFLQLSKYSLENVALNLNISFPQGLMKHGALGDAITNGKVFCTIITQLQSMGYIYLMDILKLLGEKRFEHQEMVIKITDAIFREKKLRIRYLSLQRSISDRLVLPKKIEERNKEYFLIAYCYVKNEERTFALNRILSWEIIG